MRRNFLPRLENRRRVGGIEIRSTRKTKLTSGGIETAKYTRLAADIEAAGGADVDAEDDAPKKPLDLFIDTVSGIFTPVLGVLAASGMTSNRPCTSSSSASPYFS